MVVSENAAPPSLIMSIALPLDGSYMTTSLCELPPNCPVTNCQRGTPDTAGPEGAGNSDLLTMGLPPSGGRYNTAISPLAESYRRISDRSARTKLPALIAVHVPRQGPYLSLMEASCPHAVIFRTDEYPPE